MQNNLLGYQRLHVHQVGLQVSLTTITSFSWYYLFADSSIETYLIPCLICPRSGQTFASLNMLPFCCFSSSIATSLDELTGIMAILVQLAEELVWTVVNHLTQNQTIYKKSFQWKCNLLNAVRLAGLHFTSTSECRRRGDWLVFNGTPYSCEKIWKCQPIIIRNPLRIQPCKTRSVNFFAVTQKNKIFILFYTNAKRN